MRRLKFWIGGGTLSAPTGCSPQGYGGLLAVDHSLYVLNFFSLLSLLDLVEWNHRAGGGTLSAPTGCSPRDRGRLLAVDYGLKNIFFFFFTVANCWQLAMI